MAEDSTDRGVGSVRPSRRAALSVGIVVATAVVGFVVLPAVAPEYALAGKYAAGLVGFSVWMAWFVDWLAVWLGQDAHPAERERDDR